MAPAVGHGFDGTLSMYLHPDARDPFLHYPSEKNSPISQEPPTEVRGSKRPFSKVVGDTDYEAAQRRRRQNMEQKRESKERLVKKHSVLKSIRTKQSEASKPLDG